MAVAGVREFLTALDHSLVDIEAVITDLAKEDCDDIEVIRIRKSMDNFSSSNTYVTWYFIP